MSGKKALCSSLALIIGMAMISLACISLTVYGQSDVKRIAGSVRPSVNRAMDLGPVAGDKQIPVLRLVYVPTSSQSAALSQLLKDQQNPASAQYRAWISPEEFGARFGISATDEQNVRGWLKTKGVTKVTLARSRTAFVFSTTAAWAESAFQTQIHSLSVNGETHFANVTEISLPQGIAGVIGGVTGLNDFKMNSHAHRVVPQFNSGNTSQGGHEMAPGDIATMYDLNALYSAGTNGSGVAIAIVGQSDIALSDIATYRKSFNLPAVTPNVVVYGKDPGWIAADEAEGELDLELAGAVAPNAQLFYVNSTDVQDALFYAIEQGVAPVLSMSYGFCEEANEESVLAQYELYLAEANAQGMTVVTSSGDTGAADCDNTSESAAKGGLSVDVPSDQTNVTAVGGTSFAQDPSGSFGPANGANGGSLASYVPEQIWNFEPFGAMNASGGGASIYYSKPYWQSAAGVPADGQRDVPDVAMFSEDERLENGAATITAYIACTGGQSPENCDSGSPNATTSGAAWGGTSAAGPVFSGVVALLNQYLVSNGTLQQPGLGNINPELYSLAQVSNEDAFNQIAQGNNIVPCVSETPDCTTGSYGYSAGADGGYNQATGLGSVDGFNLIHAWGNSLPASTVTLTSTPQPPVNQAAVTLTATVTGNSTSGIPTGTVTFYSLDCVPAVLNSGCATNLGTEPLDNTGAATLSLPNGLAANTMNVYAAYSGSVTYAASFSHSISARNSSVYVTLYTSASNSGTDVPVTFYAYVPWSGSVTFYSNLSIKPLGTVQLVSQKEGNNTGYLAYLTYSTLPLGVNSITAFYSGSTTMDPSTSAPVQVTVTAVGTTTTLTTSAPQILQGGSLTLTATVQPFAGTAVPTGQVSFYDGTTLLATVNLTNAVASFTSTTLPVGSDSLTAVYAGTSTCSGSTSSASTVLVSDFGSTTGLTTSATQILAGGPVTLTATVTPASGTIVPTGQVSFYNGRSLLSTASLINGVASITTTALPVGSDYLSAVYAGTSEYNGSTSSASTVTVTAITTTTALAVSTAQVTTGNPVTLTATVTAGSGTTMPNGSVSFYDGNTLLAEVTLNGSGVASYTTTALPVGSNSLTADYTGTNIFGASLSGASPVTVSAIATTTALAVTASQVAYGSNVTLTATVTPGSGTTMPTGSVSFYNGTTLLSTASLANGAAIFTTWSLPVGSNSLTAVYAGTITFSGSASGATTVTVAALTTTILQVPSAYFTSGSQVTLTATVIPGSGTTAPTGQVSFYNGTTLLATTSLSNEVASFTTTALPIGTDSLTAVYAGTSAFNGSTSNVFPVTVVSATSTTTALTSSASQIIVGGSVTLTAKVTPASGITTPAGNVGFYNGTTLLATESLTNGVASFITTALPIGSDSLTAVYSGSSAFDGSASSVATVSVSAMGTATTLAASPSQIVVGDSTTLTATTTPASGSAVPSGQVSFFNGTTLISTADLTNGQATFTTTALPLGSDFLTAVYAGTSSFKGSTSGVAMVTVSCPTPALSTISPGFTNAGGSVFRLTVGGEGFGANSTVYWGSTALMTQYVSESQLTAQVPTAQIASAGIVAITVQSPAPGGGSSNPMKFEVDSASPTSGDAPVFTTNTATVQAGTPASYSVTLPSTASSVSVNCLNLPSGASCSYSSTTNAVTIATGSTTTSGTYQITVVFTETLPGAEAAFVLFPILFAPLIGLGKNRKAKTAWFTACLGLIIIASGVMAIGCGGGSSSQPMPSPNPTHQVTSSGTLALTIQ